MDQDKLHFITKEYIPLLKNLQTGTMGKWGKMNGQQMVEHVAAFFFVSSEKIKFELVTPREQLPKFKEFLLSDKQFRENTKAPVNVIGEEPLPLKFSAMDKAIENLSASIIAFEDCFKDDPYKITVHPVFGELNFEEWVLLHYKHITHHLRQFALL